MKLTKNLTSIIAGFLLIFVFLIAFFSVKGDSLTMDELAHLPAGYSYLTQKDMRLNPEHPPIIKDLAALPLSFIKGINFPDNIKDWKEDVNGQWGFGNYFLFKTGNPADQMIFWSRIPMILVLVLFGFYVFKWTREAFGDKAGLLALFLFSFSPTMLAHGRLVTTDVGAAAGIFIGAYYFICALKNPSLKNIIFAGIAFGLAELAKFTTIILIPFFVFLTFFWWLFKERKLGKILKTLILVFVLGFILVWPIYFYHTINYPTERMERDIRFLLSSHPFTFLGPTLVTMSHNPILKPYAQYLFGLSLVYQRGTGGNTTYFLGEISAAGWKNYFPIVYSIKEPLTLHVLTILSLTGALFFTNWKKPFSGIKNFIDYHFVEFSMLSFIAIYWIFSLISNLNIGVRHLLPIFPFVFVLIGLMVSNLIKAPYLKLKYSLLAALLIWQAISVLKTFPYFLSYFNEIAGGPNNGYIYVVDSNFDWGQDLKRLKKWVDEKNIDKIYIDYFGGADIAYYFSEKAVPWPGKTDFREFPKGNYLAVSASFLQGGKGYPVPGFNDSTTHYLWLDKYKPVSKIGHSIFVYHID